MFENIREDWRAQGSAWIRHGFYALLIYRFGRWRYGIRPRWLRVPFSFAYHLMKMGADTLLGIELPCEVTLGRRLVIEHVGGIVLSGDAVIGDDCVIRNGVTIGLRRRGERGSPVLGDRVDIGAGAKLLGSIRIGSDVAIGANAVVLCDVPDGCLAVGVPAKVIRRRQAAEAAQREIDETFAAV